MNHIIKTILLGCSTIALSSCNDSFMDRYPETSITPQVFFSNVQDLETYTNGLYGTIGSSYSDAVSDNANTNESSSFYELMRGEITPKNSGQWDWEDLREINFFIEHYHTAVGLPADINHYLGIARIFRAHHYYGKVKSYSEVPWFSRTLQTTDNELLYKAQDSRELVVDSIMQDLEFGVNHVKDTDSKTRMTKWSALATQARIALNEGTFRKYHDELGLKDADRFLKIARDAAKAIIESGKFSIYMEKTNKHPYQALFTSLDLSRNPEMIMYEEYDKAMGHFHNAQAMFNTYNSLSRDLQEDYLALDKDGKAVFFQDVPGHDKMGFIEVFKNRDPRLNFTFMQPGFIRAGEKQATLPKLALGGFPQVKFDPESYDQIGWNKSYTDLPVFRLAEIYLIYAEARAELGELTQDDLDMTINKLRQRVEMPGMLLGDIQTKIDPMQETRYPNVTGAMKGAIYEIRRERRVELACEGLRKDDVYRWKAGKRLAMEFEGIYIDKLGYIDLTGDGLPNIALVATKADAEKIPEEDKVNYKLSVYALEGNTFYLSEGDHGYIRMISQKGKFKFIEPKYYYWPISEEDITTSELNGTATLLQNKYWK